MLSHSRMRQPFIFRARRECGLRTAFVARPTEYGPHQQHDFKAEHDFDVIADSMIAVADELEC